VIAGLTVNGNLSHRTALVSGESFNSLIHLSGCARVSVTRCVLKEGMTDGIFVGANHSNAPSISVAIRDCTITTCRRNNISAVGVKGLSVDTCDLSAAGTLQGTNPMAAIDVEPEVAGTSEAIHITRNRVHGNGGTWAVLLTGTGTVDARLDGNVIEDNIGSGLYINEQNSGVYVTGNTIRRHGRANCRGLYILGTGVYAVAQNTFEQNTVGCQCDGTPDVYLTGNRFIGNTSYGVLMSNFAGVVKRLRVEHNHFLDNTSLTSVANGTGYAMYAWTDANSIVLFNHNVVESSVDAGTLQLGPRLTTPCNDVCVGNIAKNLSNNINWAINFSNAYSNLAVDAVEPFKRLAGTMNFNGGDLRIGDRRHFFSSNTPPSTGTFVRGDLAWNVTPLEYLAGGGTAYTVIGWVCITDGTPGSWLEMRALTGH
jgi:hypothetical protein